MSLWLTLFLGPAPLQPMLVSETDAAGAEDENCTTHVLAEADRPGKDHGTQIGAESPESCSLSIWEKY